MQLKIEREALKKETDAASKDRLEKLDKELAELEERSAALTARWQAEKEQARRCAEAQGGARGRARTELEQAQRKGEYQRAGELTYGVIPELEKQLKALEAGDGKTAMVEEAVTPSTIAQVVSRWTGIPVDKMLEGEREKLLKMEEVLREARHRPEGGGGSGLDRGAPGARRPAGPEPADRLVHVPRPDRRRQDRADQGAGELPVRRRGGASSAST